MTELYTIPPVKEPLFLKSGIMNPLWIQFFQRVEDRFREVYNNVNTYEDRVAALENGSQWPVGSVFVSLVSTNPNTLLGFGTWEAYGTGKVLVGIDPSDSDFDTVNKTGGAKDHDHSIDIPSTTTGAPSATATVNSGAGADVASGTHTHAVDPAEIITAAESNLQPYTVVYIWKRTA